jgi:NADH:ubiquinone oxidoreductase subunit 4 (subunit M)
MLSLIFFTLIITIFVLFFIPGHNKKFLQFLGLSSSGFILILSVLLFIQFENNSCFFQNVILYNLGSLFLNFDFIFGFDGISIDFFLLTVLLFFLSVLFIWNEFYFKEYLICLLLIELCLLLVFYVL